MKSGRSLFLSFLLFFAVSISVFYLSSCQQDKCKATNCAYGGTCNNGVCTCLPGYTGPTCDTISSTFFLGSWNVTETGTITSKRSYTVFIHQDTLTTDVIIYNFYNYFQGVKATIKGDSITIPNQQVQGKVLFGKGYIAKTSSYGAFGAVVLNYEVIDTANTNLIDDFGYYPYQDGSAGSLYTR